MAALTSTVHVHDEHGVVQIFGPGDTVPAWAKKLITNPKAWDGQTDVPAEEIVIPPKRGPKATLEAWTAYATAKGFEVDGDASRKEVIDTLNAAGIPTE